MLTSVLSVSDTEASSGKLATASAIAGAGIATIGIMIATNGCTTTAPVTTSVNVFCTTFQPIPLEDEELDKLPLDVAQSIVGHNAVYESLCVKKGIIEKIKDKFRSEGHDDSKFRSVASRMRSTVNRSIVME